MKAILILAALLMALTCTGCSTHMTTLKYIPQSERMENTTLRSPIALGSVTDERGTDSNWLGAIRGGYGNPIKKLRTDKDTSEEVAAVFSEALRSRNLLGTNESSRTELNISITKFDCSYYFNSEAHAHINVRLVALPMRTVLLTKNYRTDDTESGVGAGIFGDINHLANFAQITLSKTIDKILSDPALLIAAQEAPVQSRSHMSASERVMELERLRNAGLITESEFNAKRAKIIGDL
jgi:uncharacterized lipoprotein YajG